MGQWDNEVMFDDHYSILNLGCSMLYSTQKIGTGDNVLPAITTTCCCVYLVKISEEDSFTPLDIRSSQNSPLPSPCATSFRTPGLVAIPTPGRPSTAPPHESRAKKPLSTVINSWTPKSPIGNSKRTWLVLIAKGRREKKKKKKDQAITTVIRDQVNILSRRNPKGYAAEAKAMPTTVLQKKRLILLLLVEA